MYKLCQSFQNVSISPEVFTTLYTDLLAKTWELTKLEISSAKEQYIDGTDSKSGTQAQVEAAAQRAETSKIAAEKILEDINKKIEELKAK